MKRKKIIYLVVTILLLSFLGVVCVNADDEANWSYSFINEKGVEADIIFSGHVSYKKHILFFPGKIVCYGSLDGKDEDQITYSNSAIIKVINKDNEETILNKLIYADHELDETEKKTYAGWVQAKWSLYSYHGSRIMQ